MQIKDTLILDIARLDEVDILTLKQNNQNVNVLEVNIVNDGIKLNLTNYDVRCYVILPNKEHDLADLKITNALEGTAELLFKPTYLSKAGSLKVEFIITHNTETAITKTVIIAIERSIINSSKVEMTEQYSALIKALSDVNIIKSDETIYIPGPPGPQGPKGDKGDPGSGGGTGGDCDLSNYVTKPELENTNNEIKLLNQYQNWQPNTKYKMGTRVLAATMDGDFLVIQCKNDITSTNNINQDMFYNYWFIINHPTYIDQDNNDIFGDSNTLQDVKYVGKANVDYLINQAIQPLLNRITELENIINTKLNTVDTNLDSILKSLE